MRISPAKWNLAGFLSNRNRRQLIVGAGLLIPATAFIARVPEADASGEAAALDEANRAASVAAAWNSATTVVDHTSEDIEALAEEYKVPVDLATDIHEAAVSESIDPKIAFGLVRAESRFKPTVVSRVGAVGLTQVMPSTAKWLVPGTSSADLRDPETNLKVGFKYLRTLLDRFEGNEKLALTAYNRGPGTVSKILNRGGDPDNGYAEMVMTGKSAKHVKLMNAKFGKKASSKAKVKHKTRHG